MSAEPHPFRFSGRIAPQNRYHQEIQPASPGAPPDEHYIAPRTVKIKINEPPHLGTIGVAQYSATVDGGVAARYNPAGDCDGNFMSYKFQPNNNCYAYGTNITPNTFPQPGRQSGYLLTSDDFKKSFEAIGEQVSGYAVKDGLVFVGRSKAELETYKAKCEKAGNGARVGGLGGHFVALMISPSGDANWPGDYHWARCDNSSGACDAWSQKDGGDQVTNFDFAGNPITDPSTANWTVNQGPVAKGEPDAGKDQIVEYAFYCFMFVPSHGVKII